MLTRNKSAYCLFFVEIGVCSIYRFTLKNKGKENQEEAEMMRAGKEVTTTTQVDIT